MIYKDCLFQTNERVREVALAKVAVAAKREIKDKSRRTTGERVPGRRRTDPDRNVLFS